jgi:hypothetical protein
MSYVNPYQTLLREQINPMVMAFSPDQRPDTDPFLSVLGKEVVTGIQTDTAGRIDVFAFKSQPAIIVGDKRAYKPGTRDIGTGTIKLQYYTEQVIVTEDELKRMQENGSASLIGRNIDEQRRFNNLYLISQIQKYAVDPWGGVTTSTDYNKELIGMFASSSTGTLTDPADMNASAGTPLDLSTTVKLQGSNQTANNITAIMGEVTKGLKKIDFNSKIAFPYSKIYVVVHPLLAAILRGTTELLNSTTGQRGDSYANILASMGVTLTESVWADSDYAAAEDGTTQMKFFTDPQQNFKWIANVPPAGTDVWSPWTDQAEKDEASGNMSIYYESHKSMEMGFFATPYYIYSAAATATYLKALFVVTVTGYDNED